MLAPFSGNIPAAAGSSSLKPALAGKRDAACRQARAGIQAASDSLRHGVAAGDWQEPKPSLNVSATSRVQPPMTRSRNATAAAPADPLSVSLIFRGDCIPIVLRCLGANDPLQLWPL